MSEKVTERQIAYGVVVGILLGIGIGIGAESIYLGVATGFAGGTVFTAFLAGQAQERHREKLRQAKEAEADTDGQDGRDHENTEAKQPQE